MWISHRKAIVLSGILWLGIGVGLLYKGLNFIIQTAQNQELLQKAHLFKKISPSLQAPQEAALMLISFALLIGMLKGRVVLSKTVARVVKRIMTLPNPLSIKDLYAKSYYFIIGGMILLGVSLRWMPISWDIRGFVDVAIGSALINGAVLYFRNAFYYKEA